MTTRNSTSNLELFPNIKLFILLHFTCIKAVKVSSICSWERVKRSKFNDIPAESTSIKREIIAQTESELVTLTEASKSTIKTLLISWEFPTSPKISLSDLISKVLKTLNYSSKKESLTFSASRLQRITFRIICRLVT